jgi:hypothetical protein
MGTFAETAIIDYHLSFANQGKQTSVEASETRGTTARCPHVYFLFLLVAIKIKFAMEKNAIFRQFRFPFVEFQKRGNME